jgi:hypothetical protein
MAEPAFLSDPDAMSATVAVVLAGGKGSRLHELTERTATLPWPVSHGPKCAG